MQHDELAFLEEMIDNAELLNCTTCQDETLHTHEEVVSVEAGAGVTEVVMRCTSCMTTRLHLIID